MPSTALPSFRIRADSLIPSLKDAELLLPLRLLSRRSSSNLLIPGLLSLLLASRHTASEEYNTHPQEQQNEARHKQPNRSSKVCRRCTPILIDMMLQNAEERKVCRQDN